MMVRKQEEQFLSGLSTSWMEILGVGQPAHPPDNVNQDLALCSPQAHQTPAMMGSGISLGRKSNPQKMHS